MTLKTRLTLALGIHPRKIKCIKDYQGRDLHRDLPYLPITRLFKDQIFKTQYFQSERIIYREDRGDKTFIFPVSYDMLKRLIKENYIEVL